MKKTVIILSILLLSLSLFSANAYVLNSISRTVSKIDLETGQINNSFASCGLYSNKLLITADFGYVVNSGDNNVQKFNLDSGATLATIQLENSSNPYDIVSQGNYAYVSGLFTNKVYKINLTTDQVEASCTVGTAPEGLCILDNKLFVANTGVVYPNYNPGTVSVIDLETFTEQSVIPVHLDPQYLVTTPDSMIHVVCTGNYSTESGKIDVIDKGSLTVVNTVNLGGSPANIAYVGNGNIYLGDGMGMGVYAYNYSTLEIIHGTANPLGTGGAGVYGTSDKLMILSSDYVNNSHLYVYDFNESLLHDYAVAVGAVDVKVYTPVSNQDDVAQPQTNINAYPNPFAGNVIVSCSKSGTKQISKVDIYNIKGCKVNTLVLNQSAKQWNGKDTFGKNCPTGIYFLKAQSKDNKAIVKKVTLIR